LAKVLVAACAWAALANRHRFFVAALIRFLPSALIWRLGFGGSTVAGSEGSDSPLIAAEDAIIIDSTGMPIDEVFAKMLMIVQDTRRRLATRRAGRVS